MSSSDFSPSSSLSSPVSYLHSLLHPSSLNSYPNSRWSTLSSPSSPSSNWLCSSVLAQLKIAWSTRGSLLPVLSPLLKESLLPMPCLERSTLKPPSTLVSTTGYLVSALTTPSGTWTLLETSSFPRLIASSSPTEV